MKTKVTAVGVFEDRTHAEYAVEELQRRGFPADQISVLIPDAPSGIETPPLAEKTKAGEGAATGAAAGAALGGLVGAALVSAVIPGVGPVFSSGLLAAALGGTLTGLAGGGLVGALIGLEIPEEEARGYEREFHSGRSIVTVRTGERYDEAVALLQQAAQASLPAGRTHSPGRLARLTETESDSAPGAGTAFSPLP
ncbi:MAG TPA: hypothetical protein VH682_09820 [Gemmataceae bacterium]|jgi:hypothetical protein